MILKYYRRGVFQRVEDVVNHLVSVGVHPSSDKTFKIPKQEYCEPSSDNTNPEHLLRYPLGVQYLASPQGVDAKRQLLNPVVTSLLRHEEQEQYHRNGGASTSSAINENNDWKAAMLQQYQQQPDYTPYSGYGTQPNAGYFNYAGTESSWYGSPTSAGGSGGDHALMVSHNALVR